ncbi:hypothetical protein K438DRAFT_1556422 [Mycena galopus ATCC 62051]|nr:hypothetical protein K438DRAFT_1556422 [Mycena galopus ATCC 62051]
MLATCSICLEPFTAPMSLPCGHIFCRDCIRRTVNSLNSCAIQHFCPTCRAPCPVLTIDPALVPAHLRPHIQPPLRPVFFDEMPTVASSSATSVPLASTSAVRTLSPSTSGDLQSAVRAVAELNALKEHCAMWRQRAEMHAAANTALLGFVRGAKDCALRLGAERDAERSRCVLLKRKLAELM